MVSLPLSRWMDVAIRADRTWRYLCWHACVRQSDAAPAGFGFERGAHARRSRESDPLRRAREPRMHRESVEASYGCNSDPADVKTITWRDGVIKEKRAFSTRIPRAAVFPWKGVV